MSRDNYADCYLYYRTGELAVFSGHETPEGWTLAHAERLHGGREQAATQRLILEISNRLPFLPI